MPTPTIAVFGGVNLDTIVAVGELPGKGATACGDAVAVGAGGKARNQAVAAASGAHVAVVARVGDDAAGRTVIEDLDEAGVDTSHVGVAAGETTGRYVSFAGPGGSSSSAWHPGANTALTEADVVAAGGPLAASYVLCQLEVPDEAVAAAIRRASGRVVLDCGPDAGRAGAFVADAWMVRVNAGEAERLTGQEVVDEGTARRAARSLLARGPRWASISAGAAGDLLASTDGEWWVPAPSAEVRDTTGAGDALLGVTVVLLASGAPPHEAARAGARAATQVMGRLGA